MHTSQERELAADEAAPAPNVVFDDSGNFVLYPTLLGVKVVNLVTNRVARIIGKVENTERFLRIALYQARPHHIFEHMCFALYRTVRISLLPEDSPLPGASTSRACF